MSKKNFLYPDNFAVLLVRVDDAFTFVVLTCMRSQRKPTYISTVICVKRLPNTFVFPGMAGREMATGRGHGEMETGRGMGGWGRGENGERGGGEAETGLRGQRLVG